MGFARLLTRSSSRDVDSVVETEPEVDVSEATPDPAVELPPLDDIPVFEEAPAPIAVAPVASAPVVVPQAPAPGATGTRVIALREPEGWSREDDDDAQPRRRVQGDGLPGAARRPRPAGQPDDEPGAEPGHDRDVDVRRPRPQDPDHRRDRASRGRPRRRLDRSRRRRARARRADRPRALAREGARRGARPLRLHPHRHAAVTRPADDQRLRRRHRGDRPGAVRVPRVARARPAREHARHGAREPESARRRRGDRADDVRRAYSSCTRGSRDPGGEFR